MSRTIHNPRADTSLRLPNAACLHWRTANRNRPEPPYTSNRNTRELKTTVNHLKTNEKRFSNRNCVLRLARQSRLASRRRETCSNYNPDCSVLAVPVRRGGALWQNFLCRPIGPFTTICANDGGASRKRLLTRYTYRVKRRLFSLRINNITKNYSIHFQAFVPGVHTDRAAD